ncbi:MAG: tetratricopeptide repeat protein [Phycisphaerales bacterium JB040]
MGEQVETNQTPATDPVSVLRAGWRTLWQAPALLIATALLTTGVVTAVATAPEPSFTPHLNRAETLITRGEHRPAIDLLNEQVFPWVHKPGYLSEVEVQRYHALIARAVAFGQRELGLEHEANYQTVLREYHNAEQHGATLGPQDLYALADAYVALGQPQNALARVAGIDPGQRELKDRIHRRVVEGWLGSARPRYEEALGLLTEMLTDPTLPTETRVWALARRAQVQLGQGYPEEAITRLVRALPRLEGAGDEGLAELSLQLGRAYLAIGAVDNASDEFARVVELGSSDQGELATVEIARVHMLRGGYVEARDLLSSMIENVAGGPALAPALLVLAEAHARLARPAEAVEVYARLVDFLREHPGHASPTVGEVVESLLDRYGEQMDLRDYPTALRFVGLASRVYPDFRDRPEPVVLALARAHAANAQDLIGDLGAEPVRTLAQLEPSTRAEAQRHLIRSAAHFRDHADRTVLSDIDAYGESLWRAADLYDRAGDQRSAIDAFREYVDTIPGAPHHAEARYRLGRAHQALGEYEDAAEWYRGLIRDAEDERNQVAGFAVRSYVPLAQCELFDDDPENDENAERLLLEAVSGTGGRAIAGQLGDALFELGSHYYRTGRHERAIERLTEALSREQQQAPAMLFRLADAHRLLADEIERSLEEPMPEREREARASAVARHRRSAMAGFERTRDAIEAMPPTRRTTLDRLQLRNACFYLGDCAFDLGDYDLAIAHYDAAKERYPSDPASLVAMVQIVNAHVEQGDLGSARTANERARRFYLSLPESAWDDPNLPMDRGDWERWLQSSAMLYEVAEGE